MVSAIIVAGGKGVRMQSECRKQYLQIGGQTVLGRALKAVGRCDGIGSIYVVVPEADMAFCRKTVISPLGLSQPVTLVAGGPERQASVFNALRAVEDRKDVVVIHDGVRPFIDPEQILRCIEGARASGACILGIPVQDTLKRVDRSGTIRDTLDREDVWMAQTPQAFRYGLIRKAHDAALAAGITGTDDALLVERLGLKVKMVAGNSANIKITTPDDLVLARAIAAGR